MEEFVEYLDSLLNKSGAPILCGDFNFKVNQEDDPYASKFINLIEKLNAKDFLNILMVALILREIP